MKFISVTKPGIIFGNIVTVSGGFFLGSRGRFDCALLFFTMLGMSLIIAAGCILNNYIDRDIDKLMERTKHRPTATGHISSAVAIVYAILLGIAGFAILYLKTNLLTVVVSLIGLFFYVVVYSLYLKRTSVYGTVVGAIAGAVPPVVGYCAVTNRFDIGAILLFLILALWQMPHFYAISIYRLTDYQAASIPVLPIRKGIDYTKKSMLIYILAFTVVSVMPSFFSYTGYFYFTAALVLGLIWFFLGLKGFKTNNDRAWARNMFLFSIINITILSFMMAVKQ
ncbi:MAG: protoheme IX farnesyltransferase [Legionellales bacterium]|nr:protoheme IX farnesyltransferase [Legionellales bacterium]